MSNEKAKPITLRLPKATYEWLKLESEKRGCSMNAFIAFMLHQIQNQIAFDGGKASSETSN
jgi:hypothetical protein